MSARLLSQAIAVLSVSTGLTYGTMTVAWKLPENWIQKTPSWSAAKKCSPPAGAPEDAIHPGDELWDLKPVIDNSEPKAATDSEQSKDFSLGEDLLIPKPYWSGAWAVYNATSCTVIASGTRNEILGLEGLMRLHSVEGNSCIHLEYRTEGHPERNRSFSLYSANSNIDTGGWTISVTELPGNSPRTGGLRVNASWPGPIKDTHWDLNTTLILADGERTLVAKQGDWELWITAEMQSMAGGSWRDQRRILSRDDGNPTQPLTDATPLVEAIDTDRRLWWQPRLNPNVPAAVRELMSDNDVKEWAKGPWIQAPPEWHSRVNGRFHDLLPLLISKGVPLKSPGDFAGYDPLADEVVILTSAATIPALEEFFPQPLPPRSGLFLEAQGISHWALLGSPTETSSLFLNRGSAHDSRHPEKEKKGQGLSFIATPLPRQLKIADPMIKLTEISGGGKITTFETRSDMTADQSIQAVAADGSTASFTPHLTAPER